MHPDARRVLYTGESSADRRGVKSALKLSVFAGSLTSPGCPAAPGHCEPRACNRPFQPNYRRGRAELCKRSVQHFQFRDTEVKFISRSLAVRLASGRWQREPRSAAHHTPRYMAALCCAKHHRAGACGLLGLESWC